MNPELQKCLEAKAAAADSAKSNIISLAGFVSLVGIVDQIQKFVNLIYREKECDSKVQNLQAVSLSDSIRWFEGLDTTDTLATMPLNQIIGVTTGCIYRGYLGNLYAEIAVYPEAKKYFLGLDGSTIWAVSGDVMVKPKAVNGGAADAGSSGLLKWGLFLGIGYLLMQK